VNPDRYLLEEPPELFCRAQLQQSKSIRITGNNTFYRVGEPVGKSCDQVGRSLNGEILATDSEVYDKWAQALSSADDLTYLAFTDGMDRTGDWALSLVFPVLVVPNGRLWVTHYDAGGSRTTDPIQTDQCSFFVNFDYFHRSGLTGDEYTVSHLEFVTQNGICQFVEELTGDDTKLSQSFPAGLFRNLLAGLDRR
jgi:hypothetical protein